VSSRRWQRLNDLVHEALARPPAERADYVARECGDDAALAAEVAELLASHDPAEGLMERPAIASAPDWLDGPSVIGRRFGPWRVLREIGRGGMGAVFELARIGDMLLKLGRPSQALASCQAIRRW